FSATAAAVVSPRISAPPDVVVGEADGFVDLPVTLSAPGQSSVSVAYATANSTAIGGAICNNSYVGVSGTLNFVPGDTTKVVRVDLLNCNVAGFKSFRSEERRVGKECRTRGWLWVGNISECYVNVNSGL